MLKKLASHTFVYGLATQIPRLATFFTLPFITPYLTSLDFGVFGLLTAIVSGMSAISTLGLSITLSNIFYKHPERYGTLWRQVYGFLIIWNFFYAVLLTLVLLVFIPNEASSNSWILILLNILPIVLFGPTSFLGTLYYQLRQKPREIAFRSILVGFTAIAFNIYFIKFLKIGYLGWFASICIAQFLEQVSYLIPLLKKEKLTPIFNFKRRVVWKRLEVSLPVIPHFYSVFLLNSSDRVILRTLSVGINQIGLYNIASSFGGVAQQAAGAVSQAIGPILLKGYKDNKLMEVRRLIFAVQVIFFEVSFLTSIWMKEIFQIFIKNKELQTAYPLAIILVMAVNYRPMYFAANTLLFYLEKTKSLLKISLVAGLVSVALNFLLIPVFGYEIIAYVMFICLMYLGYSGFFLKIFRENNKVNYYPVFWLLITIALTFFVTFAVEFKPQVKLIICSIMAAVGAISLVKILRTKQ